VGVPKGLAPLRGSKGACPFKGFQRGLPL